MSQTHTESPGDPSRSWLSSIVTDPDSALFFLYGKPFRRNQRSQNLTYGPPSKSRIFALVTHSDPRCVALQGTILIPDSEKHIHVWPTLPVHQTRADYNTVSSAAGLLNTVIIKHWTDPSKGDTEISFTSLDSHINVRSTNGHTYEIHPVITYRLDGNERGIIYSKQQMRLRGNPTEDDQKLLETVMEGWFDGVESVGTRVDWADKTREEVVQDTYSALARQCENVVAGDQGLGWGGVFQIWTRRE